MFAAADAEMGLIAASDIAGGVFQLAMKRKRGPIRIAGKDPGEQQSKLEKKPAERREDSTTKDSKFSGERHVARRPAQDRHREIHGMTQPDSAGTSQSSILFCRPCQKRELAAQFYPQSNYCERRRQRPLHPRPTPAQRPVRRSQLAHLAGTIPVGRRHREGD